MRTNRQTMFRSLLRNEEQAVTLQRMSSAYYNYCRKQHFEPGEADWKEFINSLPVLMRRHYARRRELYDTEARFLYFLEDRYGLGRELFMKQRLKKEDYSMWQLQEYLLCQCQLPCN